MTTPAAFFHTITKPGDYLCQAGLEDTSAAAAVHHTVSFGKARSPMGFLDVTDPAGGGIYVGTHDPQWHDTDLIATKGVDASADIEMLTYHRVAAEEQSCPVAVRDRLS